MSKRFINKYTAILLFSIMFFLKVSSQESIVLKLDSFFNTLNNSKKAMGCFSLMKNNKIIYTKALGYSIINDTLSQKINESTKFRIGSITKIYTTALIFQLIEQRKLSLNTKLNTYFPKIPNAKTITIEQMLLHRSGLYDYIQDSVFLINTTKPITKNEYIEKYNTSKPYFKPNQKAEYSNTNFILLGFILETIYNDTYDNILKSKITEPLKLTNTYAGGNIEINKNECFPYSYINKKWTIQPIADKSVLGAAGVILSTPNDLNNFINALFKQKLINKESLTKMKTIVDGYGMGLIEYPFYKKKSFGHTGGIDEFRSTLLYFPEDSLSLAYCTNAEVYPKNSIVYGALSIYYGKSFKIPVFKEYSIISEDLDKYMGSYSNDKIPLTIKITKSGVSLIAQATGQPSFELEADDKDTFKSSKVGVRIKFNIDKKELILFQGGQQIGFNKTQ